MSAVLQSILLVDPGYIENISRNWAFFAAEAPETGRYFFWLEW
jgi:hypothetical protein